MAFRRDMNLDIDCKLNIKSQPISGSLGAGRDWSSCPVNLPYFCRESRGINDVIVQELCESRGGRPGLSVLTSTSGFRGHKDLLTPPASALSQLVPNMSTDI